VSYSHAADGSLAAKRGGGGRVSGLTSGLRAVAADGGVLWLCAALSEADRQAARQDERAGGPGEVPVRMLDIPPDVFDAAYNGIANSVLWFVHHMLFDTPIQPVFDAEFRARWDAYVAYNEAFADALAQESAPGTRALIQDYHLSLVPRLLRDRHPAARIASAPTTRASSRSAGPMRSSIVAKLCSAPMSLAFALVAAASATGTT
jgi:trehalose 6-phosphate synthase